MAELAVSAARLPCRYAGPARLSSPLFLSSLPVGRSPRPAEDKAAPGRARPRCRFYPWCCRPASTRPCPLQVRPLRARTGCATLPARLATGEEVSTAYCWAAEPLLASIPRGGGTGPRESPGDAEPLVWVPVPELCHSTVPAEPVGRAGRGGGKCCNLTFKMGSASHSPAWGWRAVEGSRGCTALQVVEVVV